MNPVKKTILKVPMKQIKSAKNECLLNKIVEKDIFLLLAGFSYSFDS